MKNTSTGSALGQFNWFDPQRIIFISFFLFGSLGVVAIKELGLGPIIAIAFSALIMLGYILYCGTRKYEVRAEILGDNIYYMGFLFTLVSLAYTLYKFTSTDNEIDQIIKNFGIALTTTLIGVVGRVYFNQTKDETAHESASLTDVNVDLAEELARDRAILASEFLASQQLVQQQALALGDSIRQTGEALATLSGQLTEIARSTGLVSEQLAQERARHLAQMGADTEAFAALNVSIRDEANDSVSALERLQSGLNRLSRSHGQTLGD